MPRNIEEYIKLLVFIAIIQGKHRAEMLLPSDANVNVHDGKKESNAGTPHRQHAANNTNYKLLTENRPIINE